VADALARMLAGAVAAPRPAPPPPLGRSVVPSANDWRTAVRWPREKKQPAVKASPEPEGEQPPADLSEFSDGERLFRPLEDVVRAGCTAYLVREWFRISCKHASSKVEDRGRSEAMAINTPEGTTLVAAFLEGDHFKARIAFPKRTAILTSLWPLGEELPEVYGYTNDGRDAKTPPVPPTAAEAALCACHREVTGAADCAALTGTADADCERTYAGDCAQLLRCARGDGAAPPVCVAGQSNLGVTHRCSVPAPPPKPAGRTGKRG